MPRGQAIGHKLLPKFVGKLVSFLCGLFGEKLQQHERKSETQRSVFLLVSICVCFNFSSSSGDWLPENWCEKGLPWGEIGEKTEIVKPEQDF